MIRLTLEEKARIEAIKEDLEIWKDKGVNTCGWDCVFFLKIIQRGEDYQMNFETAATRLMISCFVIGIILAAIATYQINVTVCLFFLSLVFITIAFTGVSVLKDMSEGKSNANLK